MSMSMHDDPETARPEIADLLLALIIAVIVALPSLPGRMSADSLNMYEQAVFDSYTDQHVVLIPWIWHRLGVSPGLIAAETVIVVVAFVWAFLMIFRAAGLSRGRAGVAAAALALFPPVHGYLTGVSKDSWTAAVLVLLFGLAVVGGGRGAFVVRALLAGLAVVIRPETVLLLPLLAFGDAFIRRAGVAAMAAFLAIGLVVPALNGVFVDRVARAEKTGPDSIIYLFDLVGLSLKRQEMLLPPAAFPAQDLQVLERHFHPSSVNTLVWGVPKEEMAVFVTGEDLADLRRRWIAAILANPLDYLEVRWPVIKAYLRGEWRYHPGIDPHPDIRSYFPAGVEAMNAVMDASPRLLASHIVPMTGAFVLLIALHFGARDRLDRALAVFLGVGLCYQGLFLILIPAPDYRFGYAGVVIFYLALAAAVFRYLRALSARARRAPRGKDDRDRHRIP
ncbi:MAG: hypothetical protein R3D02_07190 [Hyphomicrobiales bacterium]